MNRSQFLRNTSLVASSLALAPSLTWAAESGFPVVRIPASKRKFQSPAVEKTIARVQSSIGNQELAWMFGNCFPNTLDTTVDFEVVSDRPDTCVISGDIDAMWLRDSSAQVWPYLAADAGRSTTPITAPIISCGARKPSRTPSPAGAMAIPPSRWG